MGVDGEGIGIGLVAPRYWYSCGAEYRLGLVGLLGECAPKSMLPRLWKLPWSCCDLVVAVVLAEAMEFVLACTLVSCVAVAGGDFAMGRDIPRSLPRLATPTPQVSVVR